MKTASPDEETEAFDRMQTSDDDSHDSLMDVKVAELHVDDLNDPVDQSVTPKTPATELADVEHDHSYSDDVSNAPAYERPGVSTTPSFPATTATEPAVLRESPVAFYAPPNTKNMAGDGLWKNDMYEAIWLDKDGKLKPKESVIPDPRTRKSPNRRGGGEGRLNYRRNGAFFPTLKEMIKEERETLDVGETRQAIHENFLQDTYIDKELQKTSAPEDAEADAIPVNKYRQAEMNKRRERRGRGAYRA